MNVKEYFRQFRDGFVIREVERMTVPEFPAGELCRVRIRFTGKVQMVGFRLETKLLADRLGLTGSAVNQQDGSVLAEVQGTPEKINYLIEALHSVKRIKITHYDRKTLTVVQGEEGFRI